MSRWLRLPERRSASARNSTTTVFDPVGLLAPRVSEAAYGSMRCDSPDRPARVCGMLLRSWESGVQWRCSLRPPAPYGETSHGPGAILPARRLLFAPQEDEGLGGNAWASPFGKEIALAARKRGCGSASAQLQTRSWAFCFWLRLRTQAFR